MKVTVKDKIAAWFYINVIKPRLEILDTPGIVGEKTLENRNLLIREFILPEDLFVELEKHVGKELYCIGKKFGYYYSSLVNFPTILTVSEENFSSIAYFLVKEIEAVYASKMIHKINFENKMFNLLMQNYIICRKNGLGYIFSEGGIAGIWAWAVQDKSVEALQIKCQGRGDPECEVVAAPYEKLKEMGHEPIICKELKEGKFTPEYRAFNSPKPCRWAKNSLKSLIDAGFAEYKHGQVTLRGERFFLCEASFMYILEKELAKIKNGLQTLWEVSFDFGKKLAQLSGNPEPVSFIMDFFPALGFGDILVIRKKDEYEIFVNQFPWLEDWKEVDFTMFRGMLSGVLSELTGEEIELRKIKKNISSGSLSLYITT